MEGRVSSRVLLVTRTATIGNAERFFFGDHLAFMSDMVDAIVNTMKVNSFTASQVNIIYDNNSDEDFFVDDKLTQNKEGIGSKLRKKQSSEQVATDGRKINLSGLISHHSNWGKYITESDQGEMFTTVRVERDLVDFMISEFQSRKIKVDSIETPGTAVLYLRNMVPYSYDSLNKLVVRSDDQTSGEFFQFTKDAPSNHKNFYFDMGGAPTFVQNCINVIENEIQNNKLRNPYVMLLGNAFSDIETYHTICDELNENGISILDIYGTWQNKSQPINMVHIIKSGQNTEINIDSSYGICIAEFLRTLESKPENMVEGFHPMIVGQINRKALAYFAKTVATMFLIYGIAMTGTSAYEVYTAKQEYNRAYNTTDSQLYVAQSNLDLTEAKLDALDTIDDRYKEVLTFVYAQVSDELNIASVDTIDMLPTDLSSDSNYSDETETTETEVVVIDDTTGSDEYVKQQIDIRGYSKTSDGPVNLFAALTNAGLGEVQIVGIEQVQLPSGEYIFAFEMTVGVTD
jgi:hypothetical protein